MSKHLRYDSEGNEKYFLHAVDAREAVEMGFYFETNPVKDAEKRAQIKKDKEESVVVAPKEDKKSKKDKEEPIVVEDGEK